MDNEIKGEEKKSDRCDQATKFFNNLSLAALIIGIVSFIIFVIKYFSIKGG